MNSTGKVSCSKMSSIALKRLHILQLRNEKHTPFYLAHMPKIQEPSFISLSFLHYFPPISLSASRPPNYILICPLLFMSTATIPLQATIISCPDNLNIPWTGFFILTLAPLHLWFQYGKVFLSINWWKKLRKGELHISDNKESLKFWMSKKISPHISLSRSERAGAKRNFNFHYACFCIL